MLSAMAGDGKGRGRGRRKQSSEISLTGSRPLDRKSRVPLHYQLGEVLKEKLESGTWKAGTLFPSERVLEEHFRISRSVVRPALALLAFDGEIKRVRGSGTFVLPPKRKVPICGLLRALFAPQIDELSVSILDATVHAKDGAVSDQLEIKDKRTQIVQVTAVLSVGEPVCVVDSFFAANDFPWLLALLEDLRDGNETKKPARKPKLTHSAASVESSAAVGEWTGATLKADPSSPAMVGRLVQYGRPPGVKRERPVEFARLVYRADRAQLTCAGA
jgi:GntR family transcriptional regulator